MKQPGKDREHFLCFQTNEELIARRMGGCFPNMFDVIPAHSSLPQCENIQVFMSSGRCIKVVHTTWSLVQASHFYCECSIMRDEDNGKPCFGWIELTVKPVWFPQPWNPFSMKTGWLTPWKRIIQLSTCSSDFCNPVNFCQQTLEIWICRSLGTSLGFCFAIDGVAGLNECKSKQSKAISL